MLREGNMSKFGGKLGSDILRLDGEEKGTSDLGPPASEISKLHKRL